MVMDICVLSVVAFFSGPACAAPGKQKKLPLFWCFATTSMVLLYQVNFATMLMVPLNPTS